MRLSLPLAFVAFALLPLSAPAQGQESPAVPRILQRAIDNADSVRYSGVRTVSFRRGARKVEHTETVLRDGSRSRVEFAPDSMLAGQIVVETGDERRHFLPKEEIIRVGPARREESFRRLTNFIKKLGDRARITQSRGERIAGLPTALVVLADKDGNVLQRLNIEPRRGIVLRRQLFDAVGTVIGEFEFKEIDLNPRFDETTFTLNRRGARVVTPEDDLRGLLAGGEWVDRRLPASLGYRLEEAKVLKQMNPPVLILMYSGPDGRLGLHQAKGNLDRERLARFARGGDMQFRLWQTSGRSFVLLGDLPQARLREIARLVGEPRE